MYFRLFFSPTCLTGAYQKLCSLRKTFTQIDFLLRSLFCGKTKFNCLNVNADGTTLFSAVRKFFLMGQLLPAIPYYFCYICAINFGVFLTYLMYTPYELWVGFVRCCEVSAHVKKCFLPKRSYQIQRLEIIPTASILHVKVLVSHT